MFSFCETYSQIDNFKFPQIELIGKSFQDFVPTNWKIKDSISGDFNKDTLQDIILIVESNKTIVTNKNECFSTEPFYPKMIIICFRKKDGTFYLSRTANKLFGKCNWGIQGEDPYEKTLKRRNTFGVKFLTGGTTRNYLTYYFRFQDNDWYLIGSESYQYWANHTEEKKSFYNESINLIKGLRETFNEDKKGNRTDYKIVKFSKKPLLKLVEFDENSFLPFIGEYR